MKHVFLALIFAAVIASLGCSSDAQKSGQAKADQSVVKEDGSTITVSDTQGIKAETRTFESGDVARATRITKSDGSQRGLVEFRDGRTVELKDKSEIGSLMDVSADHIKVAAIRTWEAIKTAGEDAAEKGKEVGQQIGDKTKQGREKDQG
jgi:hypothetical protein